MKVKYYSDVTAEPTEEAEGITLRRLISPDDGAPNFTMRYFEVQPGATTPYHSHSWEHEVYIMGGKGVVRGEGHKTPLEPGNVVYVAPNDMHQFTNAGEETFSFLCLIPNM